jgi:hypothetical protein
MSARKRRNGESAIARGSLLEKTMTCVTVQLTPETEQQLRLQAVRRGQTLETYLRELAEKEARSDAASADMLVQGLEWLTHRGPEDMRAARERILGASPAPRDVPAGKTVLDMIEGKWPGSETDAEIRDALDRIS